MSFSLVADGADAKDFNFWIYSKIFRLMGIWEERYLLNFYYLLLLSEE